MIDLEHKIRGEIIYNNKLFQSQETEELIATIKNYILYNIYENRIIAIAIPRSNYLIASILALIEAKLAYVLVDMDLQPKERIEYILNDANVAVVLSVSYVEYELFGRDVVYVDELEYNKSKKQRKNPFKHASDLAYINYTSGTTGMPKGVKVSRNALNNFVLGILEKIPFEQDDVIASFTSPGFDIFFLEAILPMYLGLTVVIATEDEKNNPQRKIDLIKKFNIDMLQITPSELRMLYKIDESLSFLQGLSKLLIGGEQFPAELLSKLKQNKFKIYNMYGPTEATIWTSVADLSASDYVHLGTPLLNTEMLLLDAKLYPVSTGDKGEICISGLGLADGYHNKEDLSKEKFCAIPHMFGKIIYRTGDIGIINEDGNLLYIGRCDNQIKLRGYRIELEEIEKALSANEYISETVVCFDKKNSELIAFYISKNGQKIQNLYDYLKLKLPKYMIPNKFVLTECINHSYNGKIDRISMIDQYMEAKFNTDSYIFDSLNTVSNIVFSNMSKYFGVLPDSINGNDSFEQLGFDSIKYVELILDLERAFGLDFEENVLDMYNFKNVNQLCEYISRLVERRQNNGSVAYK